MGRASSNHLVPPSKEDATSLTKPLSCPKREAFYLAIMNGCALSLVV